MGKIIFCLLYIVCLLTTFSIHRVAKDAIECISEFRKCLRLFPKTFYGLMLRNIRKIRKNICTVIENKAGALHHLKCVRDERTSEKLHLVRSVVTGWTKVMTYIANENSPEVLLPYMCCAFHFLYDDSISKINEQCASTTGDQTSVFIMSFLKSAIDDMLDFGCATHKSLKFCQETMSSELQEFKKIYQIGLQEPFSVTPVVPLLKIATSLHLENL